MVVLFLMVVGVASVLVVWLTGMTVLAYVALGAALAGLLIIGVRAWWSRRRKASADSASAETDPADDEPGADTDVVTAADQSDADTEAPSLADESDVDDEEVSPVLAVASSPAVSEHKSIDGLDDETIVCVVVGRKRFHLPTCERLDSRQYEELTLGEASEEGFSPCTWCCYETKATAKVG